MSQSLDRYEEHLAQLRQSKMVAIVWDANAPTSLKVCADLGTAIAFDKTIVIIYESMEKIPARLRAVADHFIRKTSPEGVAAAIAQLVEHHDSESIRAERPEPAGEPQSWVAIGNGEVAPFAKLPLTCPECGEENLPLLTDPSGTLTFIRHCGNAWLRGQPKL